MAQRKKTLQEIKQLDFVKMSELAELNGVRYSTVKHYAELGLLPYEQRGKRLARYYPTKDASSRLQDIIKMREGGKTLTDIIDHFVNS